jgi:hypothetical protein
MGAIGRTRSIFLILFMVVLQGCSVTDEWQRRYADRWGPDSTLVSDDVANTLARQHKVMQQVVTLAYADTILPGQPGMVMTPASWYQVAQFGFNYVDEKCDLYMHDLFVLNREHDSSDSILKTISAASTAIIGVTLAATNAKIPLLVVAQSFGLVEGVNDAAAKSYLFEQVPGLIADKVKQARIVYRDVVDKNQAAVNDETSAYRTIKDYLTLCLPQTIEGNFLTTYIAANPIAVSASGSGTFAPNKQASSSNAVTSAAARAPGAFPLYGASAPKPGGGAAPTLNFTVKQM